MSQNEWSEHRLLLLASISEIKSQNKEIMEKVSKIEQEIAVLKFKSGLWGTLAGAVAAVTAILIKKGFSV